MKIAITVLLALGFTAGVASSQTFADQIVGVNVGVCQTCDPQIQGGVFYAKRVVDSDHPIYSYSHLNIDKITIDSVHPFRFESITSMETGVAQHIRKFGAFNVFGLATGGLAIDSDNKGFSYGGGVMATTALGKKRQFPIGFYGGPSRTAITPGTGWKFGLTLGYGPK